MDYNPRSPQNIGMEWVPILQADFSPSSLEEYGYVTRIDHSATVVSGSIGINALPPQIVGNIAEGINVYPAATAVNTGPVRLLTIPVQSGTITGSNIFPSSGSGTVAQALANPTDNNSIVFNQLATASETLGLNFGVTAFANELSGKRIVKVRLIMSVGASGLAGLAVMQFKLVRAADANEGFIYQSGIEGTVFAGGSIPLILTTEYSYVDLGDWNPTWGPGITAFQGDTIFPWRYQELANLDTATAINVRQQIQINGDFVNANEIAYVGYMALEVYYCEETRVAYGGRRQVASGQVSVISTGECRVPIRDTSFVTGKTLTPGNYLITAIHRSVSNFFTAKLPPIYAGIRQLNDTPPIKALVLKPTIVVNDQFSEEDTDVVVDLSLFTASAVVTGSHAYSTQIQAPVYGTITATQDVHVRQEVSPGVSFTQIRFYARRFGSTTMPLTATVDGTGIATLTVDEFDALDEIVDGWREVTLTLSPAVTLSGDNIRTVVWSATNESAINQWQVLGATMYTTSPNINGSSYDPPNGSSTDLTWKSPNVTGSTADNQSDATVILAQDLSAPTNFTLTPLTQSVTGAAMKCDVIPSACIPTGVNYIGLTWDTPIVCDQFDRETVSQFGTSTSGDIWTDDLSAAVAPFVDGERGVVVHNTVNDFFTSFITIGVPNQQVYAEFTIPVTATGSTITERLLARATDASNYYTATVIFSTTNTVTVQVGKRVAGAGTNLTSVSIGSYQPGSAVAVLMRVVGSWLYVAAWNKNDTPPSSWQVVLQDTSLSTGNLAGVQTRLETGVTNPLPVSLYVDNFSAQDVRYVDSTLEIQRQDDLDGGNWQTIVYAQNYCFTYMNDFEARVGEESRYRARYCDSLNFCGPWVTGAVTLASPGVTGIGSSVGDSVLIFTSNRQPLSNLAYTMVWDDRPIEMFIFPEVDTQIFQRMYGRDFQVAFRPLERGGEVFERVMLVQAAAIPIPSLANFTGLRDLAWADLPYVCVRDELGNRWYANVLVPSGNVQRGRRLYLAQIRVTEVTDTAAPIT